MKSPLKECVEGVGREIVIICDESASWWEVFDKSRIDAADVASGDDNAQEFALIADDQMDVEAEEPPDGNFVALS